MKWQGDYIYSFIHQLWQYITCEISSIWRIQIYLNMILKSRFFGDFNLVVGSYDNTHHIKLLDLELDEFYLNTIYFKTFAVFVGG